MRWRGEVINDRADEIYLVVIATPDGSGARAYESGGLLFRQPEDGSSGELISDDGRRWRLTEPALVASDGGVLARLSGHNSFWFAVTNHAGSWRLYEDTE